MRNMLQYVTVFFKKFLAEMLRYEASASTTL